MVNKRKKKKNGLYDSFIDLSLLYSFIFYTFLPHSIHQTLSIDWLIGLNFPHIFHISFGLISGFFLHRRGYFKKVLRRLNK